MNNDLPTISNLKGSDRDTLERGVRKGVNRRELMTWLMAGGATIAMAGSIVTSAEQAYAATPKKGGRLKFASDGHGPTDTLDPALNTSTIDYTRGRAVYNGLCQTNDDLSSRPELAEEYSASADGKTWTFKIRKGVTFHDGSPLTADDVVFSMNRHYGEKSTSKSKPLVKDITEWKKVDSHTVKAIMNGPNADLPAILGTPHFKIVKNGTTNFQKANGTGPYTMKEFSPGIRSISDRNENYWREGGNLDQIEITAITDAVARTSAFLSGDIDLMQSLAPKAIKKVEATPGVGIWSVPAGGYFGICAMTHTEPGNNPDFVRALQYIQRREKIVKSILKNQGTIGNDQPINTSYGADHCSELEQRPHDLDKAKFFLKKSGITSAELSVADVAPGMLDICLLMQREAGKIGLDLQLKKVPNDGYWGAVWMKTPLNVTSWNMRPTANVMINLAFGPEAPWNDTLWKSDKLGKLLVEVRAVTDETKRHEMYCEMQKLIAVGSDDARPSGMIIPAHRNYLDGKSDKIEGITRMPLGSLGGYEWPEFAYRTDV